MLYRIAAFCVFAPAIAFAQAPVGTGVTKITEVSSYNQFGGGDVTFKVETPISECDKGYWMTTTDVGFKANLSLVLSAYQAKNSVVIFGVPDELWAGSPGNKICKLYNVKLN